MADSSTLVRTARQFEFYARYVWPLHRLVVRKRIAKRCGRCALSERCSPLDGDGICRLCREHEATGPQPPSPPTSGNVEAELNHILAAHQGRGEGAYDALLLFSGGKDSVYMLKRIRDEFPGLRILALTVDNTFMSPVARDNVTYLIRELDVDHLFYRASRSFMKTLFRYCLTHLNEDGGYGTVDFSDGEFLLDTARRTAAEKHIPLILCGYSRYQLINGLKLNHFESPRERELSDRRETAGIPLDEIFSANEAARWWRGSAWPEEQVARLLFPLFAWDLEEGYIKECVVRWGLVRKGYDSPIVTNHELIPVVGVVDVHQMGYSSFEVEFCRMIREGKADKGTWQGVFELLEHTSRTGLFVRPTVLAGLHNLDLTLADVGIRFDR